MTDLEPTHVLFAARVRNDYGAMLKLLILTGSRRDEIASLRWQEIDLQSRKIVLPAERIEI